MKIVNYLDITSGSVVAVVGCGGKSSLIELLAGRLRGKKVLVAATTKMFPVNIDGIVLRPTLQECVDHEPQRGIQQFGLLNSANGKLEALPDEILARMVSRYDITLLEADGSRNLPCKGWLAEEPAVPPYCTHTAGIVTMSALGKAAAEDIVCRLPEFLALTGLEKGETITMEALEAMVCDPQGMFQNSAGRRYLLVNQVEDDAASSAARDFLCSIKKKHPNHFERLLYGSVHLDTWQEA